MTSGFTVYYVALDSQSQMLDTQQIIADNEVAKIKEKFVVAASSDPTDNNRLSVQVVNTGNNPVEIADVWIINKTDAGEPATKYTDLDFRDVSIPIGYGGNILENHTPLYLNPTIYDIKVVSSIGTIQKVEYDVNGGSNILSAQMVAIPQDVRFGENVTVTLIVTNVGTTDTITQVTGNPLNVSPNQCSATPNPIFIGPTTLSPSQSTMFFWDCILNQPIGNVITFSANATGLIGISPIESNIATDSVIVRDFTSGSEGEEIVLKDELFGKPGVFMIFPNYMGAQSNNHGVWGVNVANPTPNPINVTKVIIAAVSPRATSSDKLFKDNCHAGAPWVLTIAPTTDKWTCPESNQLMWKDYDNPQVIPPKSVFSFLVKAPNENVGGSIDDTANWLVQPVVYTTLGQFGKAGYATAMHTNKAAIANVFLSRTTDSIASADIIGTVSKIDAQSLVKFNATLADMDILHGEQILAGARIIINIPKDWGLPAILPSPGYVPITVTQFPDGSSQIVGTLTAALDGAAKSIQFTSLAPNVNSTKMYVMHMLADGFATGQGGPAGGYSIGPIAESILQVCPTTSPPPECI